MADLYHVEDAIRDRIAAIVYPAGVSQPSVTGSMVRIYRGWPESIGLNADLAKGTDTVTIFSDTAGGRETTRYPRVWRPGPRVGRTLFATVDGTAVTFSGTGQAGLFVGIDADGMQVTYALAATDTPASVAAALAPLLPGAVANDATLEVAGALSLSVRIECGGTATMETRRQIQTITVTFWSAAPEARDALVGAVDAALSEIGWLQLADGTAAHLAYRGTEESDSSENANLYRRDIKLLAEYPTIVTAISPPLTFGSVALGSVAVPVAGATAIAFPAIGAIRFDGWYDPEDTIDQQLEAALSDPRWMSRLPPNAQVSNGSASWPDAVQATLDAEIEAAALGGIDFFAFDSYGAGDGLSVALSLYLSSSVRGKVGFCMLGQSSAWADPTTATGYSAELTRDISLLGQQGYQRVAGGRPLYLVLDASPSQLANLPGRGIADAIAMVRSASIAQGSGDPYIIWLSGAALVEYDNVAAAIAAGADAAGAYACPVLNGSPQAFASLASAAELDWTGRAARGFPMIPTAMSGWDQRPLIDDPQPFYPIGPGLTDQSYYLAGAPADIATHVADMCTFMRDNAAACVAGIGLIYAWNELAEGGWVMPTYTAGGPDSRRVSALGAAIGRMRRQAAAMR